MRIERDDSGDFNVRGAAEDGLPGWGIQVWAKGSDPDGPEDYRYRIVDGACDRPIPPEQREAVFALIAKWEDQLPVMVAAPLSI